MSSPKVGDNVIEIFFTKTISSSTLATLL